MLLQLIEMCRAVRSQLLLYSPSLVRLDSISVTLGKLTQQLLNSHNGLTAVKVSVCLHL